MRARILIIAAVAIPIMAMGQVFPQPPDTDLSPARDTIVTLAKPDTSVVIISGSTRVFYGSDEVKNRKGLSKLLRRTIFVDMRERSKRNAQIVDEAKLLERFDGKQINSITYERHDVFEDKSTWFRSLANGMHMRTVESALERDLLFREGDEFDSETAVTSNQIVMSRPYISDSWFDVSLHPDDTTRVDITLVTFDNWTIGVAAKGYNGGRAMFYLYDYNFLGMGTRVGAQTYFRYRNPKYLGNLFDYENLNFLGTFYTAAIRLGHDYENTYTDFTVSKEFIRPTDYEAGISYNDDKFGLYKVFAPDTLARYQVNTRVFDIWGGWSQFLPARNASFFLTTHFLSERFPVRPGETAPRMHPLFHDRDEVLFGSGFYWERFYSSTMIFGYGFQEYIAAGQKLQLVGGYSWQEFGNYCYVGMTGAKGGFTRLGYVRGESSIGSYINTKTGKLWMSAVNIQTAWFSNLLNAGRSKMRFFLNVGYTKGWNRGEGAGSLVRFSKEVRPASFDTYAAGSNRFLINTETVVFTPLQPLGFRIALFGFADAGWIGCNNNTFRNDFYSTFGVGVRFKNERLVFGALQIRLGFAVGKRGLLHNDMITVKSEQRMNPYRFIPTRPETVYYE